MRFCAAQRSITVPGYDRQVKIFCTLENLSLLCRYILVMMISIIFKICAWFFRDQLRLLTKIYFLNFVRFYSINFLGNPRKCCQKSAKSIVVCIMAEINKHAICAVCFENHGLCSKYLSGITEKVEGLIINYVWPVFSREKLICPAVICSSCKRNLYPLDKGDTKYIGNWIEKISKVNI